MAGYQVKLPVFEGPFDLLFHLIEDQKIDIYDIPISAITAQYLDYLHMMESMDMDIASAFLVMAATLLEIKSKTLLPRFEPQMPETGDEYFDEETAGEDARKALVTRLLEFRKFKLTALELREMERKSSRLFTRSIDYQPHPAEILQIQISPNDLLNLFQGLVRRRLNPPVHKVIMEKINLTERINQIRLIMRVRGGNVSFSELIRDRKNRLDTVISFMAVLEMVKAGEIGIHQRANFGPINLRISEEQEGFVQISATG